jgi:hypothetical protein
MRSSFAKRGRGQKARGPAVRRELLVHISTANARQLK